MLKRFLINREAAAQRNETARAVRATRIGEAIDDLWARIPFASKKASDRSVAAGLFLAAAGAQAFAWVVAPASPIDGPVALWAPLLGAAGGTGVILALYGILGGHRARAMIRSRAHHPAGKGIRA